MRFFEIKKVAEQYGADIEEHVIQNEICTTISIEHGELGDEGIKYVEQLLTDSGIVFDKIDDVGLCEFFI